MKKLTDSSNLIRGPFILFAGFKKIRVATQIFVIIIRFIKQRASTIDGVEGVKSLTNSILFDGKLEKGGRHRTNNKSDLVIQTKM